jgi:hypothetical protein
VMLARGGDAGDPNASKNAASRAKQHAAKVAAQKKASGKTKAPEPSAN